MKPAFDFTPQVPPLLLAYPSAYALLVSSDDSELRYIMDKCCELALNRPAPDDRVGGYHTNVGGFLFTVWSVETDEPDIFILSGPRDGFGPGHTCPTAEELQMGNYGGLIPISLLL